MSSATRNLVTMAVSVNIDISFYFTLAWSIMQVQHFYESLHQKKALSVERFLSLIQFAVQQVLGYGFIPITRAWCASASVTV